jgi:hypothetical protein
MRATELSAKQIAETLMQIMLRLRRRWSDEEWTAVEEASRYDLIAGRSLDERYEDSTR